MTTTTAEINMPAETNDQSKNTYVRNISLLFLLVLAFILIPFFLFQDQFDLWSGIILDQSEKLPWIAFLLIIFLATDVFLPVPSSMISTGAGFLFGFTIGTTISFTGMTIGVLIGYVLGNGSRRALPWLDDNTKMWLENFFDKKGIWAVALARPIPVLAEASVIFAGMSKMSFSRFIFVSSLSNLGISLAYAGVGAFSVSVNSFLLAFLGSMLIPLIWAILKIFKPRSKVPFD